MMHYDTTTNHLDDSHLSFPEGLAQQRLPYSHREADIFYDLEQQYTKAAIELAFICHAHQHLLEQQSEIKSLLTKLLELLNDAAGGDFRAIRDVEGKGADILFGTLDILEDIGIRAESNGLFNPYIELEQDLFNFHVDFLAS